MPLVVLAGLFLVTSLAELAIILAVGDAIGVWLTLALLFLDSLLGAALMRSQGRAVWRRFVEAAGAGRIPHREVLDGVLVIFGGAFLITPGFLTDIAGIALLLPPTRALVRRRLARSLQRRAVFGFAGTVAGAGRGRRRPTEAYDVEGTAYEQPDGTAERDAPRLRP